MTQPEILHSSLSTARAAVKKQLWAFVATLALVLVGAGLLTTIQLAQQNQDISKQAASATSISLSPLENPVKVDQVFTVAVMTNADTSVVKALDISLAFDPTVLQLQDVTKGAWLSQAEVAIKKLDQTNGKAFIGLVIPPTASPNFVTGQGVAAIATFKALKESTSTAVTLNTAETVAGAANEGKNIISNYSNTTLAVMSKDDTANGNLVIYSYEACIYQGANGHSLYMLWRPDTYPSATAVEVSETSNFSSYGDKSVVGAKVESNGWSVTDGTNFRKGGEFFNFNPDITYYFRMKYDGDKRSGVVSFKPTACAGTGGINYQLCNQNCNSNSDCGTNLVCSGNKCRRDGNTGDDKCVLPPDKGIKRACNEYCSDSSECGSGLTCWYNQCRNPKDTTIATCKLPLAAGEVDGCNRYCADSSECGSGLTCWYNQCRLEKNLQNNKCQVPRATSGTTSNKGGVGSTTKPTATPTGIKVIIKGTVNKTPTVAPTLARPTASIVISAKPTVKAAVTVKPTAGVTSKKVSSSLGWVPGALGIILLVVIGLIAWPQVRAAMNPPKAKVVPPSQPPQR
jgi:hypothetical protein